MQKVYLLLRHNQQTGPFNVNELLQFDLKPHDLIWIEGKSAGWYYPQEIEALRPYLPFLKQAPAETTNALVQPATPVQATSPKKIFVSMPSQATVKEEAKQTPLAAPMPSAEKELPSSAKPVKADVDSLKTSYSKSMQEVETDYMNWAVQKKAKKRPVFSKSGVLVLCLLAVAAFAAWWKLNPSSTGAEQATAEPRAQVPVQNELPADNSVATETTLANKKATVLKKQKAAKNTLVIKQITAVPPTVAKRKADALLTPSPAENNDYEAPVVKEETKPAAEQTSEPTATEAPKEKKKLRDKIFDLFKKKPEEKKDEAKPVEEKAEGRQSTRREAGSSLAQMVSVRFTIPNDWMMGIKGAKATLTNKSGETLAKAVVEVVYYNDENEMLAKKTIQFSNVKSKQSQTVSVPEHETATRLEYNVISATGLGEPVARL